MNFTITSEQILYILGLITAIWGVYKIILELRRPSSTLKKAVDKHSEILDNDNRRLKELEQSNKMILQCMLVMINHDITGNGIDKMKAARDELQEYLINR